MTDQQLDPAEGLALAQSARTNLAELPLCPKWYAPVFGAGTGGVIASLALDPPWSFVAMWACFLGIAIAYQVWSRRAGLRVNGYRQGRTRTVAVGLALTLWALIALTLWMKLELDWAWAPLAGGLVAAVVASVASRMWDAAWRAQITNGATGLSR